MPAAPTTTVTIQGIAIAIPTGPLVEPSATCRDIMSRQQDARGWKYPLRPYYTYDRALAVALAGCYDFYLGGSELDVARRDQYGTLYQVGSRGYYHYIGA